MLKTALSITLLVSLVSNAMDNQASYLERFKKKMDTMQWPFVAALGGILSDEVKNDPKLFVKNAANNAANRAVAVAWNHPFIIAGILASPLAFNKRIIPPKGLSFPLYTLTPSRYMFTTILTGLTIKMVAHEVLTAQEKPHDHTGEVLNWKKPNRCRP